MHRLFPKAKLADMEVNERIKLYRWILYAQIASTVLIALGFILFILIIAGIIHT